MTYAKVKNPKFWSFLRAPEDFEGLKSQKNLIFLASEALKIFWGSQKRPNFWNLDLCVCLLKVGLGATVLKFLSCIYWLSIRQWKYFRKFIVILYFMKYRKYLQWTQKEKWPWNTSSIVLKKGRQVSTKAAWFYGMVTVGILWHFRYPPIISPCHNTVLYSHPEFAFLDKTRLRLSGLIG